jgi:hypothetical protein
MADSTLARPSAWVFAAALMYSSRAAWNYTAMSASFSLVAW